MRKFIVMALVLLAMGTNAQQIDSLAVKYAETITADELKEHLMILASDEYEGRETGEKGQKMAAEYIANYFKSLGVEPVVNGSYFQEFPLKTERTNKGSLMMGDINLSFYEDFYFFSGFSAQEIKGEAVFAGYGVNADNYSDYKDIDVKGKIVFVLPGEPKDSEGNSIITGNDKVSEWTTDWRMKRDYAMEMGAKALITYRPGYDQYIGRIKYWLENPGMSLDMEREERTEVLPMFFTSEEHFAELIANGKGGKLAKLQKKIMKKGVSIYKELSKEVSISVQREQRKFTSENVLCFIPGSDPELADEVVVVTSHYDHVGKNETEVFNGADDDGSGTVTVLEIAEAFMQAKKDGNGPRRSVLIMTVSGEEKGLLGSEWYSENPIFPLENTVCDLNVDMIGRVDEAHADNENYIYLIGSDKLSTQLHDASEAMNSTYTKLELDYTYNDPDDPNRFYYRSDHYNFAKHGIPVIFYFSGVHEDYHQPTDTPDKIMYEKTSTIAKLIFHTAWEIANRDQRLVVDVENDFE
ncbi:M28 family peptidase [Sanyastnella coralliicola]|uniref:M28 family peptidase n=1 Tax=Sanyastnella coralliicola TaxID=3069118 RepID=UPI0027B9329F|nr:M28 family peptidase [Longitalea sp. SCSIO 12813]